MARLLVQGVASRDIKLENTLLDGSPRPLLKICDFGYSKARSTGTAILTTPSRCVHLTRFAVVPLRRRWSDVGGVILADSAVCCAA